MTLVKECVSVENEIHIIDMQRWIRIVFILCVTAQVFLIICDYIFNYLDLFNDLDMRRIWNLAREKSIPTWFSAMQTQALGMTVFFTGIVQFRRISHLKTMIWILIGMFFFWIGVDDFAEIHERLGSVLERLVENRVGENIPFIGLFLKNPSYNWHTFMTPLFALCGLGITVFLWTAFRQTKLFSYLFLGFGCWVVAQAIDYMEGLDQIESLYKGIQETLAIKRKYGVTHTFKVVEEVLEMFGTTLLWIGFLRYFAMVADGFQIQLKNTCSPGDKESL